MTAKNFFASSAFLPVWKSFPSPGDIIYGLKGINPVCVQSAKNFLRRPRGAFYISAEDFLPEQLEPWLQTQRAIATEDKLYIRKIEPPTVEIHFEGPSVFYANEPCVLEFSQPALMAPKDGTFTGQPVTRFEMKPKTKYVLERAK